MLKTRPAKEVVVKMPSEMGALDGMLKTIADKGANILAASAWVDRDQAIIHVVSDDHVRVVDALRAARFDVREAEVLVTEAPHKPGMLRHITEKLAGADIDIHHLYATASSAQDQCLVVFATANNDRARVLLNVSPRAA